jgi:hypothetical protein
MCRRVERTEARSLAGAADDTARPEARALRQAALELVERRLASSAGMQPVR